MANNSSEALNELRAYQGSRRKSSDILQEQQTQLGLPSATQRQAGLRAAISNTENLIKAVDPSVTGRTSGSLVSEAQRTRLVGMERAPLDQAFQSQNQAYQGESDNVNELKRQALQGTQLSIADQDKQEQNMQGLYGTLYQREQDDVARQERDRAFAAQQEASSRGAAQGSSLASLFAGEGGSPAPTGGGQALTPQDMAYTNVQKFLGQGKAAAESDYRATLASANRGNPVDKLKVELYHRAGIGTGGGGSPAPKAGGTSYNVFTDKGAQNAKNAVGGVGGWITNRLKANAGNFF